MSKYLSGPVGIKFVSAGDVALLVKFFVAGVNENDDVLLEARVAEKPRRLAILQQLQSFFLHLRRKKLRWRDRSGVCAGNSWPHRIGGSRRKIIARERQPQR